MKKRSIRATKQVFKKTTKKFFVPTKKTQPVFCSDFAKICDSEINRIYKNGKHEKMVILFDPNLFRKNHNCNFSANAIHIELIVIS